MNGRDSPIVGNLAYALSTGVSRHRWDVGTKTGGPESRFGEAPELFNYREAKEIAGVVAQREGVNPDLIFSDAMHVAVALALEDAGIPYTGPNATWMFERITPSEIRAVLMFRRDHTVEYGFLPRAGIVESLNATQLEAAKAAAAGLTRAELDAFFFGGSSGTA